MWKKAFKWFKILVIIYGIIGIALYLLQENFLFHERSLPRNYQYHFNVPFKEIELAVNTTDTLNMIDFFPKDSVRKGIVIYYHGNKENINRYAKFADNFTAQGYEVLMEDYPGFGKSTGERTERNMLDQAAQVYKVAASKYHSDSIIIFGKSLGTGIATNVALNYKCKRLILETPYYSIPALFGTFAPIYPTNWLSHYKLPLNEWLEGTSCPVTIFHGTNDWVIPYRCAARLKPLLKPADEFVTIKGGTHNDLNDYPLFHQKLDSLLKQ